MCIKLYLLLPLSLLALPLQVNGQAAPANNIEDRVRQQMRVLTQREQLDAMMSGDTDIALTRRTRLFNVHASLEASRTNNAQLTPSDTKYDSLATAQIGIGFGTKIAQKIDVFADIGVNATRYNQFGALDYSALTGMVGASTTYGRVSLSAVYLPSIVFDRGFKKRQLTAHRTRFMASAPFEYKDIRFEPSLSVERVDSNPKDYRAWSQAAGISMSKSISHKYPVHAYASLNYERRDFDAYFPDLVGVKRIDNNWSGSVGIIWRLKHGGEIRAGYSNQRNASTSDVNIYRANSGTFGISTSYRF